MPSRLDCNICLPGGRKQVGGHEVDEDPPLWRRKAAGRPHQTHGTRMLGEIVEHGPQRALMADGSVDEDHFAAPRYCLTNAYLGGYTSINNQGVIDFKWRTLTMCSSERSPIRLGGP